MVFVHCRYEVGLQLTSENGDLHITILPPPTKATPPRAVLHPYDLRVHQPATTGRFGPVLSDESPKNNHKPPESPATGSCSPAPTKTPRKRPSKQKRNRKGAVQATRTYRVSAIANRTLTTHTVHFSPKPDSTEPPMDVKALCEGFFRCDPTFGAVQDEIAAELAEDPPIHVMGEVVPMALPTEVCHRITNCMPPIITINAQLSMVDVDPFTLKDFAHECATLRVKPHKLSPVQRAYVVERWNGTTVSGAPGSLTGPKWQDQPSADLNFKQRDVMTKPTGPSCMVISERSSKAAKK